MRHLLIDYHDKDIAMKMMLALCLTALPVAATAAPIYGIDGNNNLVLFDSNAPASLLSSVAVTGLGGRLGALDFRPLNNILYGLGSDRVVYTINTGTGAATAVSGALGIAGNSFGFDFNPTIDRLRIVSDTNNNYVFNPNDGSLTGAPTTTTLAYASGDANFGRDPDATGAAYTSSTFNAPATSTQLYVLDTANDVLARQNNNGGVLNTVGRFGADLTEQTSFDIAGTDAFALNGRTLYRVDLASGALTALGNTDRELFGIAVAAVPEPGTWATMMLGLGVVAASLRRRRTSLRFA